MIHKEQNNKRTRSWESDGSLFIEHMRCFEMVNFDWYKADGALCMSNLARIIRIINARVCVEISTLDLVDLND